MTPILAVQDGTVCTLRQSSVRNKLLLDGIPSIIKLFQNDGGPSGECVILGTTCGKMILIRSSRAGPTIQWTLQLKNCSTCVSSIDFYDVNDSGRNQMIVGRDDGHVEVYEFSCDDPENETPVLIYSHVIISELLFMYIALTMFIIVNYVP